MKTLKKLATVALVAAIPAAVCFVVGGPVAAGLSVAFVAWVML